jgi:hypothetical protein
MSFRLISSEPRLAKALEQINLGVLPKDVRDWAISWVRDVGTLVRSRDMMVGFVASIAYYLSFLAALRFFEGALGVKLPG